MWAAAAAAWWTDRLTLPVLIVVAALSGVTAAVAGLASNAMMKHVVPVDRSGSAQAANHAREATFQMTVNPLGGWLMTLATGAPLLAEAIGQGAAAVVLTRVRADTRTAAEGGGADEGGPEVKRSGGCTRRLIPTGVSRLLRESTEGFHWVGENRLVLRIALAFCLLSMALTAVTTCLTLSWAQGGLSTSRTGLLTAPAGVGSARRHRGDRRRWRRRAGDRPTASPARDPDGVVTIGGGAPWPEHDEGHGSTEPCPSFWWAILGSNQ